MTHSEAVNRWLGIFFSKLVFIILHSSLVFVGSQMNNCYLYD